MHNQDGLSQRSQDVIKHREFIDSVSYGMPCSQWSPTAHETPAAKKKGREVRNSLYASQLKEGWTCRPDRLGSAQEVNILWREVRQKVRDGSQAQLVDVLSCDWRPSDLCLMSSFDERNNSGNMPRMQPRKTPTALPCRQKSKTASVAVRSTLLYLCAGSLHGRSIPIRPIFSLADDLTDQSFFVVVFVVSL